MVARKLKVIPKECLVIEDFLASIMAARAANMITIAVTPGFMYTSVHESRILDNRWIVDDPANLKSLVNELISIVQ